MEGDFILKVLYDFPQDLQHDVTTKTIVGDHHDSCS